MINSNLYEIPCNHLLHSGYNNQVCRNWIKKLPKIENLVYPIFVLDTPDEITTIDTMPGINRFGYKKINDHLAPLVKKGLQSVLIFGILTDDKKKDAQGTYAGGLSQDGPVHFACTEIKKQFPNLLIIADVCMCAYTNHGHCGVLNQQGTIDNMQSIERIAQIALSYVKAGADVIAPSDMMDGRIKAIKTEFIKHGLQIPIMSYSAKFASSLYGPFRDVCKSAPSKFDRQSYQLPMDSAELALAAAKRDIEEGADFIMVKPITGYLDIAKQIKDKFNPIMACYHVSGEYSMIQFASEKGACDKKKVVLEYMRCFRRAGIDIIITYFTPDLLDWLKEESL